MKFALTEDTRHVRKGDSSKLGVLYNLFVK